MISVKFSKLKREGPQKVIKVSVNNFVIFKPKIRLWGVFQSEKQIESRCQTKFENFEFLVSPISKFFLVRIIVHQFENLNLKICMVFTWDFEFCFQNLFSFS